MDGPLAGVVVLDAARMVPAGVLARALIELGARVLKIEDPVAGDPLRAAPPLVDGTGAGFRALYAGAESVGLDLRNEADAGRLLKLARHADVLVESFRPGSLERWGLGPERLLAANPRMVVCRMSAFGAAGEAAARVGHDLNLAAVSGLLDLATGGAVPRVQVVDVAGALLAHAAVLAALLGRARTGRGAVLDQPLAAGALPLVAWPLADAAAGGGGLNDPGGLLAGGSPSYRVYACADGGRIAVAALEPKFWNAFVEACGLEELRGAGLAVGEEGAAVALRVAERVAERPREHWLRVAAERGLPIAPVHDAAGALGDPVLLEEGLVRADGATSAFLRGLGRRPAIGAPALGEHTARVLDEFGA